MFRLRLLALFALLVMPITALAVPPPYVTGLSGQLESNGDVRITWAPSQDNNVTKYRLYYSSESILESGGLYDDFEETSGPENVYIFVDPPRVSALYVTVLAVNAAGEESEAFVEEVRVNLTQGVAPASSDSPRLEQSSSSLRTSSRATSVGGTASSVSSSIVLVVSSSSSTPAVSSVPEIPTNEPPAADGKLHLLLAEAISPTQVRLVLSDPASVEPMYAPAAFRIEGPGGVTLPITQVMLEDKTVLIDTAPQQRGTVYQVKLSEPLIGVPNLPLDVTDRTALFIGHPAGAEGGTTTQPPVGSVIPTSGLQDIRGVTATPIREINGTYTVMVQWQQDPSRTDIGSFAIRQSRDGGRTWNNPQVIPNNSAGVNIRNVPQGELHIVVHVLDHNGLPSPGVFRQLIVGNAQATQPRPQVPTNGGSLPQSGVGLFAIGTSLIGVYAGWRRVKRKGS